MRMVSLAAALALAMTVSATAADTPMAAAPKPVVTMVRGTIESFDGKVLKVKTAAGDTIAGVVTSKTNVSAVESRLFVQVRPTDFVGITAHDGPNGHLIAEEIHIIPVAGIGEGQYPWDHHPEGATTGPSRAGSMTNGTVQAPDALHTGSMTNGTVTGGDKQELKVSFHGAQIVDGKCVGHAATGGCVGTAIAEVTPKTYIQKIVSAKPDDLKWGLAVVGNMVTTPDGNVVAYVTVEKNGVKPAF